MMLVTVGHASSFLTLGSLLLADLALAQPGLIVEPWSPSTPGSTVPMPPPLVERSMPDSGLSPQPPPARLELAPRSGSARWSPPLVVLPVDPWAGASFAPKARSGPWVPPSDEIVDPWADAPKPRVTARSPSASRTTIF
jgi:hypothetical protein